MKSSTLMIVAGVALGLWLYSRRSSARVGSPSNPIAPSGTSVRSTTGSVGTAPTTTPTGKVGNRSGKTGPSTAGPVTVIPIRSL